MVDTAACLAFAICTVGGVRADDGKWDVAKQKYVRDLGAKMDEIDGPVPPGGSWESLYRQNYQSSFADEDVAKVSSWDSSSVVRNEKTNMLVKVRCSMK